MDYGALEFHHNVNGSKSLFRTKHNPNGIIERYKASFYCEGFHHSLDYSDTCSLIIKPTTLHIIFCFCDNQMGRCRVLAGYLVFSPTTSGCRLENYSNIISHSYNVKAFLKWLVLRFEKTSKLNMFRRAQSLDGWPPRML